MDGFDAGDHASKWSSTTGSWKVSTATRFGVGRCLYGFDADKLVKNIEPSNKIFMGFAFDANNTVTGSSRGLVSVFGDAGVTEHISLSIYEAPGKVTLKRGSTGGGTILADGMIRATGWQYIEISASVSDTVGEVVVKADGVTVINYTGDTKNGGTNTTIDRVVVSNSYSNTYWYFDDFYLCNDTGTTNNTFLGDVRVHTLLPTADTAVADLTPTGSSSHYANVSDIPDSTATYNASGIVGHKDLYTMSDLPSGVTTIHATQANNLARKTDAGAIGLKNIVKSGGITASGVTKQLSASTTGTSDIFAVDPATSTAWTVAGVNGVEVGAEVA
ncbi:MAG: hypothetical protein B7Z19_04545 [Polynucleobacter sp. 32-46-5]|nr:MAG: hypothetical protein B7Z19_04545 [Polynucleobacter sp. 32-46-5]